MYISFDSPWYLTFLLAIPLLILLHSFSFRISKKKALKFANFEAIKRVVGIEFFSKRLTVLFLGIVLIILLSCALAGMKLHITKKTSSFSFVLAIDCSRSMESNDIFPSRIEAAKEAAKNFVDDLPVPIKVGVISFSGVPYIHKTLSDDKVAVKNAIDDIQISMVGGTNVLDAVVTSSNLLINEKAKAIILLSDGQINVNSVNDIIKYANENDLIIHTIGVGTKKGGAAGGVGFISKLDEDALEGIAYNTNGKFFLVNNSEKFEESFKEIMNLTEKKVSISLTLSLIHI